MSSSRFFTATAIVFVGALLPAIRSSAESPAGVFGPGPHPVETLSFEWEDAARRREVPVKIYLPKDVDRPAPVILFSHGLGGSRNHYAYLGEQWASHGYVSVHLQHIGSDDSLLRDGGQPFANLQKAVLNPMNSINRPKDVTFVIDELTRRNAADGPLKGRLDLDRIGMAGHSYGAFTTMAVIGQRFSTVSGRELSGRDPRIKAAIAMSSSATRKGVDPDEAYGGIAIPVFHMTGTLDDSPIGETSAAERRIPFDHMPGPELYLLTFQDGDHMIFSGRPRLPQGINLPIKGWSGDGQRDAAFQELIRESSTAFWDAYLRGDANAKTWLKEGGFKARLGETGTFEQK